MSTSFEVRVEGVLGAPTLHHLGWSHRLAGQQTVLRLEVTQSDLDAVLRTCAERGLQVERVVRLGPRPARGPAQKASRLVSTGRGPAPDGQRPPGP